MSSPQYFNFLGTVWDQLSEEDRERMGETWQGFEQAIAAVYQQYVEVNLNIAVRDIQAFATERWLSYSFSEDNFVMRPATVTSNQDITDGVNLSTRYLLKFKINGAAPIEVNLQGLVPGSTKIDEIVLKINLAVGFNFARAIFDNSIVQLVSNISGIDSSIEFLETSIPSANACEFVMGVDVDNLPQTFPKFRYPYVPPFEHVASVPEFRNAVRDENVTLTLIEGVDYEVERDTGIIVFLEEPPPSLWAKRTFIDKEAPWNNFGFLMDIYQQNSPRYVQVVQGLWFAFWNGPTPENVRRALYLLFGLPVAQEDGTVITATSTIVETLGDNGIERSFDVPLGLAPDVVKGQRVQRFQPLVTGIAVYDKVNKPGFITTEVGRFGIERFLTENASRGVGDTDETKALTMLEEYTFLPQIQVDAFIYPDIDLGNVVRFLNAIKPLNKTYLFQVIVGIFQEPIPFLEEAWISPDIDLTPSLDSNETTYQSAATLSAYETAANAGLDMDPEGACFNETVDVEVYSFAVLIDSFTI
jgi:hypothetical protein